MAKVDHKAVLVVIDGWGVATDKSPEEGNAIAKADTPVMDEFAKDGSEVTQGYTELEASGEAVGLPEGLMGNSEVGHLNIGAGRVVWQDVVRIDKQIRDGTLNKNKVIDSTFKRAKDGNGRLHFLGLVSDGGVHAHIIHLKRLLEVAKEFDVPNVYIHFFGDGRDTDPKSGLGHMRDLLAFCDQLGLGKIATVVGRYYAMDRDKRWERVEIAMEALVHGKGAECERSDDPAATIEARYAAGETDEFLKPIVVGGDEARVRDGDTLFFFNYRSDRVREITQLLGGADRSPRPDFQYPSDIALTTMTQYKLDYKFPIAFAPVHMGDVLAEWLGKQGVRQCHVAETEKYAHVTFFFNGGVEKQFEGEERELVPSPRVATYDKEPRMSAGAVADKLCERIAGGEFGFLMNNFAPPDMVGHTGVLEAAIEACAATDEAIGKVYEQCKKSGYIFFLTSDHGNAEEMINEEGKPKTSHTTNKVPFIMANAPAGWSLKKQDGVLGDVAPTILEAMGLSKPPGDDVMSGTSLLIKK